MSNVFMEVGGLSARERALSQLVMQLALRAGGNENLAKAVGLDDRQVKLLRDGIAKFERDLMDSDPVLSSLLGRTAKSNCRS